MNIEEQVSAIDLAIDDLDVLIMDLPLKDSVKRRLTEHLYTMFTELEQEVELNATDFS